MLITYRSIAILVLPSLSDSATISSGHVVPSCLGAANEALVVIDVQNDFISGTLAVQTSEEIVPIINDMREKFDCDSWATYQ